MVKKMHDEQISLRLLKENYFFISHNSLHFIFGPIYYSSLTHKKKVFVKSLQPDIIINQTPRS